MKINVNNKVGALFKLIAHKGDGVAVRSTGWFHNTVLDSGLDRMGVATWIDRCCVGTGNSTPAATQVSLDSFLASTTTIQDQSASVSIVKPYYLATKVIWRFGMGVAAGNLSEVGMGWGDASLWNRALIKDISGNPTTITVLADEYLDVVSEVRFYFDDVAGSVELTDKLGNIISSHSVVGRPSLLTASYATPTYNQIYFGPGYVYSGEIGAVTSEPLGTRVQFLVGDTVRTARSISATHELGVDFANFEHKSISVSAVLNGGASSASFYQFGISPPIPKNNKQIIRYKIVFNWGRYEPT